jgi:hypothetical protein
MRIDSSGQVGIGMTPARKLDVTGTFGVTGAATFGNTGFTNGLINSNDGLYFAIDADSDDAGDNNDFLWLKDTATGSGGTTLMTLRATGNLGIGTTSPATMLHLFNGDQTLSRDTGGGGGTSSINFKHSGNTVAAAQIQATYTGDFRANLIFKINTAQSDTSPAEVARITNGGELLVGTTAVPNVGVTGQFGFSVSSSEVVISKSGADGLIIRTTSAASNNIRLYNLNNQVGSVSTTTTATAYNTSSDYRLKNTIAPITGALAKVALLKPVTYKWNVDGSDGQGFIAHELAEVVPDCVTGEKDGVDAEGKPQYQGVDASFLVATLTAAIQELKAEFDAYKASHP